MKCYQQWLHVRVLPQEELGRRFGAGRAGRGFGTLGRTRGHWAFDYRLPVLFSSAIGVKTVSSCVLLPGARVWS
jgi:hypothetical protein